MNIEKNNNRIRFDVEITMTDPVTTEQLSDYVIYDTGRGDYMESILQKEIQRRINRFAAYIVNKEMISQHLMITNSALADNDPYKILEAKSIDKKTEKEAIKRTQQVASRITWKFTDEKIPSEIVKKMLCDNKKSDQNSLT